jgi:hypothetical protein
MAFFLVDMKGLKPRRFLVDMKGLKPWLYFGRYERVKTLAFFW